FGPGEGSPPAVRAGAPGESGQVAMVPGIAVQQSGEGEFGGVPGESQDRVHDRLLSRQPSLSVGDRAGRFHNTGETAILLHLIGAQPEGRGAAMTTDTEKPTGAGEPAGVGGPTGRAEPTGAE